ncbi:aerobic cobaltochelatase subunit CobT [Janthinobacterium sp. HH103]|uniref:cobaltochelatase CobT-related protein n=1 Tax=unclassified Janthinobacterium TaxID=2610881 RepID=UPI000874DF29|nr:MULTISPECIES: cobalt chelatase [unclassified Janthinobacterium]OEZ54901.1 aerobic cobaltochelatase subunit CobT [Janthinobacterium sp. HH100]OEZ69064.1 aerobic cobaltochelatase subunit CobT [Janthinobacterium sp. HH103]QOU72724.1 Aerobic cobaltochelatase subunit CobT [Janthinobacterium sp. HH102]
MKAEATAPAAYTREQQETDELCAGAIRALSGLAAIRYRGRRLHDGHRPLPIHAAHLQPDAALQDLPSLRGAADSVALRLLHTDAALHKSLCPPEPVARLVFELLEQLRVETLAPDQHAGVIANLRHRFTAWSHAFYDSGLAEGASGLLLYTVFQMCWSRLTARPVLEKTEDFIEATRWSVSSQLSGDLAGLRRHRADQLAFARHALAIAHAVDAMLKEAQAAREGDQDDGGDAKARAAFKLLLDFDSDNDNVPDAAPLGESRAFSDGAGGYKAYSTAYDREDKAGDLVRRALLLEYRERMDARIASLGINTARLARRFTQLLAVPQRDGWSFGEEEGYIDGRRLAQLISSPSERRLFRKEQFLPQADCLVTFLVDCSGSMKTHAESVAVLLDILLRALDQAGITTELLGFTTGAWNGGRVKRDWLRARSPAHPGRLNELVHMVFKDGETNWRRARPDIAALLKADLYREGVDGEAVDWACTRMLARPERRRILLVVSDGCPMDTATNLANDEFYLAQHLKQVVARREAQGAVEICGLGLGLDLGAYYSRSLATTLPASLNNELFSEIAQLIAGRGRR